jgi:hypothetical protein
MASMNLRQRLERLEIARRVQEAEPPSTDWDALFESFIRHLPPEAQADQRELWRIRREMEEARGPVPVDTSADGWFDEALSQIEADKAEAKRRFREKHGREPREL